MADQSFRNVVGGELVDAASGETYDVLDPTTGERYATAPRSGAEDVDRAFRAAETAFEAWGETTPAERQLAYKRVRQELDGLIAISDEAVEVLERDVALQITSTSARA